MLEKLIPVFQSITAEAFSCEGGVLHPNEILVEVKDFGPFDIHERDLQIMLFSFAYPERTANLQERTDRIAQVMAELMPDYTSFFFFPILAEAGFAAFPRREQGE